jgi:hypothetical protein
MKLHPANNHYYTNQRLQNTHVRYLNPIFTSAILISAHTWQERSPENLVRRISKRLRRRLVISGSDGDRPGY